MPCGSVGIVDGGAARARVDVRTQKDNMATDAAAQWLGFMAGCKGEDSENAYHLNLKSGTTFERWAARFGHKQESAKHKR